MPRTNNTIKYKARELHKLAVARLDLIEAQAACQFIIDNTDNPSSHLYYPHAVTTVICYARPFLHNNVYGALGKRWSKFTSEPATKMHQQLIEARNSFIAHSDGNVRKFQITPKGYIVPGTGHTLNEYSCLVRKLYIPIENFSLVKDNSQHIIDRLNKVIKCLLDEVAPHIGLADEPLEIDVTKL